MYWFALEICALNRLRTDCTRATLRENNAYQNERFIAVTTGAATRLDFGTNHSIWNGDSGRYYLSDTQDHRRKNSFPDGNHSSKRTNWKKIRIFWNFCTPLNVSTITKHVSRR